MSIFDRVKGVFGLGGSADYIGDLADDSWGEVPQASPAAFLTAQPSRPIEEALPTSEEDWEGMLRQARVREEREEYLIRVPVPTPEPLPPSTPDTDWDALLAKAKSRAEAPAPAVKPSTVQATVPKATVPKATVPKAPAPAPVKPPAFAKASSQPHPAPTPAPAASKFAMGTVPPSSAKPAPSTAFLPAPRSSRRDDEWETVIASAKARATGGAPSDSVDPWDDAIRKAKRGAA